MSGYAKHLAKLDQDVDLIEDVLERLAYQHPGDEYAMNWYASELLKALIRRNTALL